jgi:hypothetical protein
MAKSWTGVAVSLRAWCIHICGNNRCSDPQADISCPNWEKNLGQDIRNFKVTNCVLGFKEKRDIQADVKEV